MEKTRWLSRVFIVNVQRFLNGDIDGLWSAFLFDNTDQGHDFWKAQCEKGLNIEGAKALLEMVQYWKEQQTVAAKYEAGLSGKESV